jgi:prolipoprotein diacylglyceryltransferase
MLQTLFYIPAELYGLPMFGFGLLLAVWAVVGSLWMTWLVLRRGFNADARSYAQVLAVLGVAIAFVLPALCEPRGLPIRGYGMMMLLAVLSGMGLAVYRARRVGVDPDMIFALAFWMIIPGIIGARAVYVTEYWSQYSRELDKGVPALIFAVVNVAAGGLVVYGSFVGGMLGLGLFWLRHRIPLLATADLIAPSLLLGLALGRVGCLLNGCCYGDTCDYLPWTVRFPWNSPVHEHQVAEGKTDLAGLKFYDKKGHAPMIESVVSGSPAAEAGLAQDNEVFEINGIKVTSAQQAREVALGIDRLEITLRDGFWLYLLQTLGIDRLDWSVADPPQSQVDRAGPLKIYGMEVVANERQEPVVSHVRAGSPEAAAGIRPGRRITRVSGVRVRTLAQLRGLLDEHRTRAWLMVAVKGQSEPFCVYVNRPLPRSRPVHPTQLYSTIDALILCFLLLAYDRFRRRDGALLALILTVYPITRFLIEGIRTDEAHIWGTPFTISQNISLALLPLAIGLWVYILRRPPKLAFGG